MKLTTLAEQINHLRVDTTKQYVLYPENGIETTLVYKTIPAKYIVSIQAFKEIGTQCHVLEITKSIRKRLNLLK